MNTCQICKRDEMCTAVECCRCSSRAMRKDDIVTLCTMCDRCEQTHEAKWTCVLCIDDVHALLLRVNGYSEQQCRKRKLRDEAVATLETAYNQLETAYMAVQALWPRDDK